MSGTFSLLNDPHARHAILVHAPIVLGGLAALPLIALACTGFKSGALRVVVLVVLVLALVGAFVAERAGEAAEENLPDLTSAEEAAVHEHEELGEGLWLWMLIPLASTTLTLVPKRGVRLGAGGLALASSLVVAVMIARAAHAGGELVYIHGIGVPERGAVSSGVPGSAAPVEGAEDEDD